MKSSTFCEFFNSSKFSFKGKGGIWIELKMWPHMTPVPEPRTQRHSVAFIFFLLSVWGACHNLTVFCIFNTLNPCNFVWKLPSSSSESEASHNSTDSEIKNIMDRPRSVSHEITVLYSFTIGVSNIESRWFTYLTKCSFRKPVLAYTELQIWKVHHRPLSETKHIDQLADIRIKNPLPPLAHF